MRDNIHMMNPSTATQNHAIKSTNQRRQPAHLSVSLRHEGTPSYQPAVKGRSSSLLAKATNSKSSSSNKTSSISSRAKSSRKWFEKANENPEAPFSQTLHDEPPYFLPHQSSHSSDDIDERVRNHYRHIPEAGQYQSATNASNASDFRSVIDDLTIENKKLKERLRRLEKNHSPHLENERLFEVTIHGLSAKKRRKLEEKLREFTATLEDTSSDDPATSPPEDPRSEYIAGLSAIGGQKRSHGSSNSNSRNPPDSAYASMSNDAQNSSSNLTTVTTGGKPQGRPAKGTAENAESIRNFLEGIPEGLIPKGSLALTERQKQRIVVRRLEQLFTGKQALDLMDNQLAQQQEVADSAARADDVTANREHQREGHREAHMLPQVDLTSRPGNIPITQSRDDIPNGSGESPDAMDFEQEQRPTRPLDLDPDRAQVAADNVEYIRHLGLSTPQLLSEDSSDAEADAHGWVYLNLLINMAQLHIINVTPDFVRRAVKDVSHKFQLSADGNKLRWRGGSKGTKLSSSDDASSNSPDDTENVMANAQKRRKTDNGRFAMVPINVQSLGRRVGIQDSTGFHYRPMFNHQSTSTDTSDSAKSGTSSIYEKSFAAETGKQTESSRTNSGRVFSRPQKRRRDDGTMVFYSNAHFCTDLAGDREIPTPLYLEPGQDRGFAPRHILGVDYRRKTSRLSRFNSSSVKTSKPYEAASLEFTQSDISDVSVYDGKKDGNETSEVLQDFEACGLGGTQPADHFVVRVRSRRTHHPCARKSTPSSLAMLKRRIMMHSVPQASLNAFANPPQITQDENLTANMASLSASSPPAHNENVEMPVEVEYLSAKYAPLEPSQLPDPMGFYGMSEDEDSCSYESTSSAQSPVRQTFDMSRSVTNIAAQSRAQDSRRMVSDMDYTSEEDLSDEDDDDDMSIDMLGHLRKIAPAAVAARENSFDLRNEERDIEVPASAAATIAESADEL